MVLVSTAVTATVISVTLLLKSQAQVKITILTCKIVIPSSILIGTLKIEEYDLDEELVTHI